MYNKEIVKCFRWNLSLIFSYYLCHVSVCADMTTAELMI